ncbi:MAG TPA: phosphotransferase [Candidatus Cloacimonadota bacterium]|nr:phosphotransferase [Candidatus Cloacimonadota bacterium]
MQQVKQSTFSVVKKFSTREAFDAEMRVYRSQFPFCPKLFNLKAPAWINLQRIDGVPYLDKAETLDPKLLAEVIATLHLNFMEEGITLCHWDNSPGNILACGDRYYLIDFEDSRYDHPEHDLTHLLLFWLEAFEESRFLELKKEFLDVYQTHIKLDKARWEQAIPQSLNRFVQRRKQHSKRIDARFKKKDFITQALKLSE